MLEASCKGLHEVVIGDLLMLRDFEQDYINKEVRNNEMLTKLKLSVNTIDHTGTAMDKIQWKCG